MWDGLREDDHLPLLNKSLQGLYPPGSTFKPATALALLENEVAPTDAVVCTGRYRLGGGYFHCHKRGGHGVVSLNRSEEHTSELQSLMRISYAVFCLKKKNKKKTQNQHHHTRHITTDTTL